MKRETLLQARVTPEELAALDEWRRRQLDIPTRSEAIRRLIVTAMPKPPPKHTDRAA